MVLSLLCAKALVSMMNDKDDDELDHWFPRAFRMTSDRLKYRFRGILHTIVPMELEVQS